jgi:cell division protein FtsQ
VLATYRELAPKFEHMDMPIDAVSLSVGGSWKALLESGASIELGRGSLAELSERVQRFLATLTQVASRYERQPSALESADLRHENGYAIRLRGVSTVAATVPKK